MSQACKTDEHSVRAMLDGGSNINIIVEEGAARLLALRPAVGSIAGIASGLGYTHRGVGECELGPQCAPNVTMDFLYAPGGKRTIISESKLLEHGIEVRKAPGSGHLLFPGGGTVPLIRSNGLFYLDVTFKRTGASLNYKAEAPVAASSPNAARATASAPAAAAARVRHDDEALLWAARLNLTPDNLVNTSKAVMGVNVDKVSPAQREIMGSDQHRAVAQARKPSAGLTPPRDLATKPGQRFILDGFGPIAVPSPLDGAVYMMHAVDEFSGWGYVAAVRVHDVDAWIGFIRHFTLDAKTHGLEPRSLRVDRAPEFTSPDFRRRCEELGALVELTSRERHKAVGKAEKNNNTLTRSAETMLLRSGAHREWFIAARCYAQYILNRSAIAPNRQTRYQRYLNKVPDLARRVPHVFGSTVSVIEDVHGPKGSTAAPRASVGRLVGIADSSYLVARADRSVVHQAAVTVLNESSLVRAGLRSNLVTAEAGSQTLFDAAPAAPHTPPPPPAAQPPPSLIQLPLRARVEVLWEDKDDKGKAWYTGTIVDAHLQTNGKRRHCVEYDGETGEGHWHDFDSDDFKWRRSEMPKSKPAAEHGPGPVTRARRLATAAAFIENTLESSTPATALKFYNAALYQALPDEYETYECHDESQIDEARCRLQHDAHGVAPGGCPIFDLPGAACNKAIQNGVDVVTSTGTKQLIVPATWRDVQNSSEKEGWLDERDKVNPVDYGHGYLDLNDVSGGSKTAVLDTLSMAEPSVKSFTALRPELFKPTSTGMDLLEGIKQYHDPSCTVHSHKQLVTAGELSDDLVEHAAPPLDILLKRPLRRRRRPAPDVHRTTHASAPSCARMQTSLRARDASAKRRHDQ